MSNNEKMLKPKYEAPVVVALGGLAQGFGACSGGSGVEAGDCQDGSLAVEECASGGGAVVSACNPGGLNLL